MGKYWRFILFFLFQCRVRIFWRVYLLKINQVEKKKNSILFLTAFFPGNSGYHWRAKKWAEELEKEGYSVTLMHALDEKEFNGLLKNDFIGFLHLFLKRRYKQVFLSRSYETVIVQRELLIYNDYGNLFLEKLLLRLHPNAILDFDDDLSAAKGQPKKITNWYGRLMQENGNKFNDSLRMYKRFIVASEYLKNRVLEQNRHIDPSSVLVIPTCVDYDNHPRKQYSISDPVVCFGWIGGDHNYHYLKSIIPFLNELSKKYSIKLMVIGGEPFDTAADVDIEFRKWSLETEIDDLYKIDIGLMPLNESQVAKGKGGFKLIQYMGLGIVSVASAVTINKEIIDDGINSFLVENDNWFEVLENVLKQRENFDRIGRNAAEKIKMQYSFNGNRKKYMRFLPGSLKA